MNFHSSPFVPQGIPLSVLQLGFDFGVFVSIRTHCISVKHRRTRDWAPNMFRSLSNILFQEYLAIATQCFSATIPCEAGVIVLLGAVIYIRQPSTRVEEFPGQMMVEIVGMSLLPQSDIA